MAAPHAFAVILGADFGRTLLPQILAFPIGPVSVVLLTFGMLALLLPRRVNVHAWGWVLRTLDTLEQMQARSPDGAVFHPGEYFFASTQTDLLRALANAWLSVAADTDIVFDMPLPNRFDGALGRLGIQIDRLHSEAGHA